MDCFRCRTSAGYCNCEESGYNGCFFEAAQENDATECILATEEETASSDSWQHIDTETQPRDMAHQTSMPLQDVDDPELDESTQLLLNDHTRSLNESNVDYWDTYTPVNYQGPCTNNHSVDIYNNHESPASTIRAASIVGSLELPSYQPHPQFADTHQPFNPADVGAPVESRDFIEMSPRIYLEGRDPVAVWDLLQFVGNNLDRQFTDSADQLCALYALEISLQSMYPEGSPTFADLRGLWQGDEYRCIALREAGIVGNENIRQELLAQRNLSVNVILIILRILGPLMGQVFALGICEPAREEFTELNGAPVQTFTVYRLRTNENEPPTATVWLHNDRHEENGAGISHWSGFGVDRQAQSGYLAPKFVLNVDSSNVPSQTVGHDLFPPAVLPFSPVGSPYSTTDSSYSTAETPYSDLSRLNSVELFDRTFDIELSPAPFYTSEPSSSVCMSRMNSNDSEFKSLHARSSPCARARSRSPSKPASKERVQCRECSRSIQSKGIGKHLKTHGTGAAKKEKKHRCKICGNAFWYPKDVRRHVNVHTKDRPHICPYPKCPYSENGFQRIDHLQRHINKLHSGQTPPATTSSGNLD